METIIRQRVVNYEVFRTIDGKEFTCKDIAQLHEDKLTGKKKVCETCKGKGQINERWEKEWHNISMCPGDNKEVTVMKSDDCPDCKGKGYKELKWI